MFEVGDKVVHNDYGICRVTQIVERKFPGQEKQLYYEMVPVLADEYGTTYYTMVNQNEKLRAPMTREQIFQMIDSMPDAEPLSIPSTGNRALDMETVRNTYNQLLSSGNPMDWVILLKTIYRKEQQLSAQKKRISEFEAHARSSSEKLLYGEIAGILEIPVRNVEDFITDRIEHRENV